eukprot:GFYU01019726.1.p1 GENE.GFYU01019726.1~~GFYU01019726.1.p1  ORF type:complete len:355 (+),score=103.93 GFYU01019726.1:38-1102(+)
MKGVLSASVFKCTVVAVVLLVACTYVEAEKNFYKTLGVDRRATQSEIKKAYRRLSLQNHPDKNIDDPTAEERFVEIATAYEVLSDENMRARYDRYGEKGLKSMPNFDSRFQNFGGGVKIKVQFNRGSGSQTFTFNQQGQFQRQRPQQRKIPEYEPKPIPEGPPVKGKVQVLPIDLPLENVLSGGTISLDLQKNVICPTCKGSGYHPNSKQHKCPQCNGRQTIRTKARLPVDIPAGVAHGHEIHYESYGHQSPGTIPGDIVVNITTKAHPKFRRVGADLEVPLKLSKDEAEHGFYKRIKTLDGRELEIERTNATKSGDVITFENEGLPATPTAYDKVTDDTPKGILRVILDVFSR